MASSGPFRLDRVIEKLATSDKVTLTVERLPEGKIASATRPSSAPAVTDPWNKMRPENNRKPLHWTCHGRAAPAINCGSLAIFAAMRRASSLVSSLAAARRPGSWGMRAALLRQARHLFKLKDQTRGNHRLVDVTAARAAGSRDLPSFSPLRPELQQRR
jgi:hypothetical protein